MSRLTYLLTYLNVFAYHKTAYSFELMFKLMTAYRRSQDLRCGGALCSCLKRLVMTFLFLVIVPNIQATTLLN